MEEGVGGRGFMKESGVLGGSMFGATFFHASTKAWSAAGADSRSVEKGRALGRAAADRERRRAVAWRNMVGLGLIARSRRAGEIGVEMRRGRSSVQMTDKEASFSKKDTDNTLKVVCDIGPRQHNISTPPAPPFKPNPPNRTTMFMLVNCSGCHNPLQLPPAARSIRCAICQAVTNVADPRANPPPPPSHSSSHPPPPTAAGPPSPYSHAPPGPPPSAHGRKKAVIIGISYRFSPHELKGCLNDAKCMRHLLTNKFQFPESSILMLTGN
ncbi:hypothetical protein RJ639_044964 [Escallonia herrerae]|uniref:Uncharacterized protein n=1 Tax=Escallonia herrerae TaxID=1293975 RepID=A0AA88WN37_9ASTE|nr:hypothetical protein RJ639_044964 [Escallonia herrerae]